MTTGKELILKLKAKLNKLDTSSNRAVKPELALLFLNDAYIKLVRSKYSKNGGQADSTAFQYTQLTTDELDFLTINKKSSKGDFVISKEDSEYIIDKSELENYFIHLKASLKVKSGNTTDWTSPNYKTLDEVETSYGDPFNSSIFKDPVLYQEDNKFKIVATDFEVVDASISYLRKPETITVVSEHNIPFEDELVDYTATLILENWEDARAQSQYQVTKAAKLE
ncbi:hypothetical protein [Tenacibaculum sp.]|uniref:hypothetical protein n=1 Tax=Tenacibaculum sp. TaxID=1906242 RepID=UPI003D1176CD